MGVTNATMLPVIDLTKELLLMSTALVARIKNLPAVKAFYPAPNNDFSSCQISTAQPVSCP
jgi:hypothetical protein